MSGKEFLKDRPVRELFDIGINRQFSVTASGAYTFDHVAKLPSMLLEQKFSIWRHHRVAIPRFTVANIIACEPLMDTLVPIRFSAVSHPPSPSLRSRFQKFPSEPDETLLSGVMPL